MIYQPDTCNKHGLNIAAVLSLEFSHYFPILSKLCVLLQSATHFYVTTRQLAQTLDCSEIPHNYTRQTQRPRITAHTLTLVTGTRPSCHWLHTKPVFNRISHSLTPSLSHDAKPVKVVPTTLDRWLMCLSSPRRVHIFCIVPFLPPNFPKCRLWPTCDFTSFRNNDVSQRSSVSEFPKNTDLRIWFSHWLQANAF